MDFALEPQYELLRETAKRIAKEKVLPRAREIDQTGEYPQDLFEVFKKAGFLGLCIPEEFGGSGAGIFGLTLAIEQVAKYSNAAALMLLLTRLPTGPIMIGGNNDQKKRYLPGIADGTMRAAFGLSEPQAGSDVVGMRTKAESDPKSEGGYILNGLKCWMSGVKQANYYVVFAKVGDSNKRDHRLIKAFIVRRELSGVSIGRIDSKMGVKGVDTGELVLENVRVEKHDVLEGMEGFKLAMLSLNSMRPIVAARGIGLAEGALMYATEYLCSREGFGGHMIDFQGLQWEIAKLATEIEAARLLTYRAAKLSDRGCFDKPYVPFLSMAKYYATEVSVKASGLALQLLGAAGYMTDHLTELYYRDAKQLTIVEGTSQVQLGLIAKGVIQKDLWWD
jgi:alkylation response protein AidB-like acyl-CoA dehydrogenase